MQSCKTKSQHKMYSFEKIFKTAPETSSSSFLSIQLFLHLKEQIAEHFSSSLPNLYLFLHNTFSLIIDVIFLRGGCLPVFGLLSFRSSEWRVRFGRGEQVIMRYTVMKRPRCMHSHPSKMLLVPCPSAEILTGLSSFLYTIFPFAFSVFKIVE